jgi:hypothetical protein
MPQAELITREHSAMYHVLFDGRHGNATMMVVVQLTVESWGKSLSVLTTDYRQVHSG